MATYPQLAGILALYHDASHGKTSNVLVIRQQDLWPHSLLALWGYAVLEVM